MGLGSQGTEIPGLGTGVETEVGTDFLGRLGLDSPGTKISGTAESQAFEQVGNSSPKQSKEFWLFWDFELLDLGPRDKNRWNR